MSTPPRRAHARAEHRTERARPWAAALLSALLHGLALLVALLSPPITMTTPQGAAAGSPMVVDFVGLTPPQPAEAAIPSPPPPSEPAAAAPAVSRVRPTPAPEADEALRPDAPATADARTAARVPRPMPSPPAPPPPRPSSTPPAPPPPSTRRPSHRWGQPPGMLPRETAPVHAGTGPSPSTDRGRRNDASSAEPNLEVGGYQVYYDQRSEAKLRDWNDQGITELFLPLPGSRQLMVCPLEVALKRESGACRLMEPDDPALASIGDAREVINMRRVYRRGEVVWRGPGPYR